MKRAQLERYLYVLFPKKLELHHIDMDRENNEIKNLIFLPKEIHIAVHKALRKSDWLLERKDLEAWLRDKRIIRTFLKIKEFEKGGTK